MLPLPVRSIGPLRLTAAALLLIIAGVHFQQYVDFMSEVPTVGVLFLLNAAGAAGLALGLVSREALLRQLSAIGGAALAVASLVSIIIALTSSFFSYSEPSLRFPILIAIIAEALVLPPLAALLSADLSGSDADLISQST